MSMSMREIVESRIPSQCHLSNRAYNRGRRVWAAICPQHEPGVHRYTLTSGVCCWDWWTTLRDAHADLYREGDR